MKSDIKFVVYTCLMNAILFLTQHILGHRIIILIIYILLSYMNRVKLLILYIKKNKFIKHVAKNTGNKIRSKVSKYF